MTYKKALRITGLPDRKWEPLPDGSWATRQRTKAEKEEVIKLALAGRCFPAI